MSDRTDRTYSHLEENDLFLLEQKGCRRGSYGCKDQLMINKKILEKCKKRKRKSPRIVDFLKHNMTNWKTQITLTYEKGTLMSDNINIKRGIFQGDSLSPLLFCISLIPISSELNSSGYGYKIGTEQVTHLFYKDDLKLYAKDDSELEGLLRIVK